MIPSSYDALLAEARDEPPFASGSDQADWIAANCGTCVHDREQRPGGPVGPGCPLVMVALMGRTPAQWVGGEDGGHQCVEYRRDNDVPTGEYL